MWRHERDVVSLMAGLLVLMVGALFLVTDLTALSIDDRWIGPGVLLSVGAVGLLASLRRQDPDRQLEE